MIGLILIDILVIISTLIYILFNTLTGFYIFTLVLLFFKGSLFFISSKDIASLIDMIIAVYLFSLMFWQGQLVIIVLCLLYLIQKLIFLLNA